MGTSNSQIKGEKYLNQFSNLNKYEVKEQEEYSDVFDQKVKLFHIRDSSPHTAVARIIKDHEQDHFDDIQEGILNLRIVNEETPNLLKLHGYISNQQEGTYCGHTYQRYYFVEHPIGTLRDEIEIRKKFKPVRPYSEVELWGFLYSIIKGEVALSEMNVKCKNISSSNIFISSEGLYQICEQGIIKETSIFDDIMFKRFTRDTYLSPGQIENLREGPLHDDTDPFLSDIFSLAVTVIEMAYLEEQGDIYQYFGQSISIDIDKLKQRIQHLEQKYRNKKLIRLLLNMTEQEESKRIQLKELNEELERNFFRLLQDNTQTDISDNPTHKSQYVEKIRDRKLQNSEERKQQNELLPIEENFSKIKRSPKSKMDFEERIFEDGGSEFIQLNSHQDSKNSINQEDNYVSTISNIPGDDHHSSDASKNFKKAIKSSKSSLIAIQFTNKMKKMTQEKQDLLKKQQELQQIQNKTQREEEELLKIQIDISEIDKIIQEEILKEQQASKSISPTKQVKFESIEEEEITPRLIKKQEINVSSRQNPDEQIEESSVSRPMEISVMGNLNTTGQQNNNFEYDHQSQQSQNNQSNKNRFYSKPNSNTYTPQQSQYNKLGYSIPQGYLNSSSKYISPKYQAYNRSSITPNFEETQYYQNQLLYTNQSLQAPLYSELINTNQSQTQGSNSKSPQKHKYNLDRYEQRINKNNYCSDRYTKLNAIFNEDKKAALSRNEKLHLLEEQGRQFKNKVIKKQSISQILQSNKSKKTEELSARNTQNDNQYTLSNKQTIETRHSQHQPFQYENNQRQSYMV